MSTNNKLQSQRKGVAKVDTKESTTITKKTKDFSDKKPRDKKVRNMKLPTIRKIHVHPAYCVLGAIAVLLAVFFVRVAVWEHNYLAAMEGSERDVVSNGTDGTEQEADTTEPTETEVREYTVAPERPRYLSIPSLGIINSRVVAVGLMANGEIGTPYNVYDVGWYNGSSLPGSNGTAFIDAHGGSIGYSVFKILPNIKIGDTITIEMGDGRKFNYVVAETQEVAIGNEANSYMSHYAFSSPEPGVGSLTLITCTGDWWQTSRTYSHRFFVRAVLQ